MSKSGRVTFWLFFFLPSLCFAVCPKTLDEWSVARDTEIKELLESGEGKEFRSFIFYGFKNKTQKFEECLAQIDSSPYYSGLKACFNPWLEFMKSYQNNNGELTRDRSYYNHPDVIEALKIPDELKSRELLRLLAQARFSSIDSLKEIKNHLSKLNEKRSSPIVMAPNFGTQTPMDDKVSNSDDRLVFYIHDLGVDKFFQIPLKEDYDRFLRASERLKTESGNFIGADQKGYYDSRNPQQFSEISSKPGADGERFIYFRDNWRHYHNGQIDILENPYFGGKFHENQKGDCVSCHSNGLIPLTPAKNLRVAREFEKDFKFIQNKLRECSGGSFPHHGLEKLGPTIGPKADRKEAFIVQCSGFDQVKDQESIQKVKDAMNCSSCHNGKKYGVIASHNLVESIRSIKKGRMPQHRSLDDSEKTALIKCLLNEYFGESGLLENFLTQPVCPKP